MMLNVQRISPYEMNPLGDRALVVRFGNEIDDRTHALIMQLVNECEQTPFVGYIEAVSAFTSVTFYYDPYLIAHSMQTPPYEFVKQQINEFIQNISNTEQIIMGSSRLIKEIPVHYGGSDGPDLAELASWAGMSENEVVLLHSRVIYSVYMIGFAPGFPYLGGLPAELAMPRKAIPRSNVPAGSIAIGGRQTGIYPINLPGGWNVIGKTMVSLFDYQQTPPSFLQVGDQVRFVPVKSTS